MSLPAATRIGEVRLAVRDLDASVAFYEDELGFRAHARGDGRAALGSSRPLLRLVEEPGARPRPRGVSGLYHVAYLLPARGDLARLAARFAERRTPLQGAADHLVSEAIYLADPDGHGIEVYADRPREAWPREGARIRMATVPLDAQALLAARGGRAWDGLPPGATVGHVHLNVGDLERARVFYREVVGLDETASMPRASFLSAGGYHHHVAVNTWEGEGAPAAPEGTLGLRSFTIEVPDAAAGAALRARLGVAEGALARDPSGNAIEVVSELRDR